MHVKRFYEQSVCEALAAAREELGPDALVLSTEMVSASGWRGLMGRRTVALTAAVERPEAAEVLSEDRPVAPPRRHLKLDPSRANLMARLTAAGLDEALAQAVVARFSEAECRGLAEPAIRKALAEELTPMSGHDAEYAPYEVFIGPPGVGKTTTIAKIAAQARAAQGRSLGLIAADAFRAGAVEHLRSYATVIGAPFRVARSAAELDRALAATRHSVLIDTAGRSPNDRHVHDILETLGRKRHVRTHLVMAADTSAASARRVFDRFASARPSRIVITKLDEAESVIPLLGVIRERGLPVSYVAGGQRVPEDLERATPDWLAAAMLSGGRQEAVRCH